MSTRVEGEAPRDLAALILEALAEVPAGKTLAPGDVARLAFPPTDKETKGQERWRRMEKQVRAEALGLARQGRLTLYRKGKVVADPSAPVKGLVRLAAVQTEAG